MKCAETINNLIDIAVEEGVIVDRFKNIKWTNIDTGKTYRYNFKKQVMRLEVKGTVNNWVRLRSYQVSKISLDLWRNSMQTIRGNQ